MSVIRVCKDKDHPYVILNKQFLEDPNISLKLKGFLAYCLAKPDNWVFRIRQMASVLKEGKDALYSIIDEGIEQGYIQRDIQKKKGRFSGSNYTIYETRIQKNITVSGKSDAEPPDAKGKTLLSINRLSNERREEDAPPIFEFHNIKMPYEKYNALVKEFGKEAVMNVIQKLQDYSEMKAKKFKEYTDHAAVVRNWIKEDKNSERIPRGNVQENKETALKVKSSFPSQVRLNHIQITADGILFEYGYVYELIKFQDFYFHEKLISRLKKMGLEIMGI